MQKMIIKLDEQKIKRVGKYDIDDLWEWIDAIFIAHCCTVQLQADGAHFYLTEKIKPEHQMAHLALCYEILVEQEWFAASVEKWIWQERDDLICDVLMEELEENSAFKQAYSV